MKEELAFSYKAVAAMLDAKNWNENQIIDFLRKHQNPTGYIKSSLIPN